MSDLLEMKALNHHVNKLLCESKTKWVIAYKKHTGNYEIGFDSVDALPVMTYMLRNNMKKLFNFILEKEDDPWCHGGCYYVLTAKIETAAAPVS
jgi:hypothetical protein